MLPTSFRSSYLQYKSDTDQIATWLANTAKKCGFGVGEDVTSLPKKEQKKARQKVKKLEQSVVESPSFNIKHSKYVLAIRDFVPLAQHIFNQKPPIAVPDGVANALDRAILLRSRVTEQFYTAQASKASGQQSNDDGHAHFVSVLERVRETLKPLKSLASGRGRLKSRNTKEVDGEDEPLVNLFSYLLVEEPSEEFVRSATAAQPASTSTDQPSEIDTPYEAESVGGLREAITVFICYLADLNQLQQFIVDAWAGYLGGVFNFIAVSIATNTALELARQFEDDLSDIFRPWGGSEKMLTLYYMGHAALQGVEDERFMAENPTATLNWATFEHARTFYWPTYLILQGYCAMDEPGTLPMYKPGTYGFYNPSADRQNMNIQEQFQEDKILLCENLPDFNFLDFFKLANPVDDELTKGILKMIKTKEIPLWTTFAAQVYLDLHHTFRNRIDEGYEQLRAMAKGMTDSIAENMDFHRNLRASNWQAAQEAGARQLVKHIESVVFDDRVEEGLELLMPGRPTGRRTHRFLREHPIKCGLEAYYIQVNYQKFGISCANAFGSILYSAHLDNALRREGLLHKEWPDLHLIVRTQGDKAIYTADAPLNPEDYHRRFTLAMGWSATNFASDRRRNRNPGRLAQSTRGPRILELNVPITFMFLDRYCSGKEGGCWSAEDLERILSRGDGNTEVVGTGRNISDTKPPPANNLHRLFRQSLMDKLSTKYDSSGTDSVRTLWKLLLSLDDEAGVFSIDYLRMHRICWRYLRAIKEAVGEQLNQLVGSTWIEQESQLPFMVGYIFGTLLGDERLAAMGHPVASRFQPSRRLLESAATAADAFLTPQIADAISSAM